MNKARQVRRAGERLPAHCRSVRARHGRKRAPLVNRARVIGRDDLCRATYQDTYNRIL